MTDACQIDPGDTTCMKLRGALTFGTTPAIFEQAESLFAENGMPQRIDLAGIDAADSAGLALLLEWQARQQSAGRSITVENAPPSLVSLAHLCEAVELLGMKGSNGPE
jgi:phospholipid transport system transporter-binding protein